MKEAAHQLHEVLQEVAEVVNRAFDQPLWVIAEISDLRVAANGHCYMQLIEKDAKRGNTLASVRGMVWANRWWLIRDSFLKETGQPFASGLKVMLLVQVSMHEQYGLSMNILNVDTTYTLGEMARRRMEIVRKLKQDGIIDMNRELPFPLLPQRIAIISAEGAAGFGDFRKQLDDNPYGLKFYYHLFPAMMQGDQTEASVIDALERIYEVQDLFDVVVIIRGGGATIDLASFDSYPLALNVANFPLPIITGIGHDRDQTVLDIVAHTSVKTPTAAAALLIDALGQQIEQLMDLQQKVKEGAKGLMDKERQRVQRMANQIRGTHTSLTQQISHLEMVGQKISLLTRQRVSREEDRLKLFEQTVKMAQPDNILKRGFSITRLNGHAVKKAADVPAGSRLEIETSEGILKAST